MLPIGVGVTDAEGYLIQSLALPEDLGFHHIDLETNRLMVRPKLSPRQVVQAAMAPRDRFRQEIAGQLESINNTAAFGQFAEGYNLAFGGKQQEKNYLVTQEPRRSASQPEITVAEQVYANLFARGVLQGQPEQADALLQKAGWTDFEIRNLHRRISNQYFYQQRKYGFLLYPVDRGHFTTRNLATLAPASGGEGAVWSKPTLPEPVLMDGGYVTTLALYCTLPEWDRRLSRQLDRVLRVQRRCAGAVNGHVESLAWISRMQGMANLYRTQCHNRNDKAELQSADQLIQALDEMESSIATWLDEPTDTPDFKLASLKLELEAEAGKLWDLLKCPALSIELKRYMAAACQQEPEGNLPPPGPDMELEPHWVHIFETLGKCYAALDNTSYKEKAWTEHLEACVLWVADNGEGESLVLEEGEAKEQLGRAVDVFYDQKEDGNVLAPLLERLGKEIDAHLLGESASEDKGRTRSPVLVALELYKSFADTLFRSLPGPPSVMHVVLDVYADYVSHLVAAKSTGRNSLHIKLFFGMMRLTGVSPADADFRRFKDAVYLLLRAHGRQYFPGGRKPKGGRNTLSNTAQDVIMRQVWRRFPVQDANGKPAQGAEGFSDQLYAGRNYFGYKVTMQLVFWMLHYETLGNLKREWAENEEVALRYVAEVVDYCGQAYIKGVSARMLVSQMLTGRRFAGGLRLSSADAAQKAARIDAIAQRLNLLSMVLSVWSAKEHSQRAYVADSAKELAVATGLALATYGHAVKKWTLSAAGQAAQASARNAGGWLARRGAFAVGGILLVPVAGEVALVLGVILSTGLLLMDVTQTIMDLNRRPLDLQFEALLKTFGEHRFEAANGRRMAFEDFYRAELPLADQFKQARAMLHSRHTSGVTSPRGLSWHPIDIRAVVPLMRLNFDDEKILESVEIPLPAMYKRAESLQKDLRLAEVALVRNAYEFVTQPGRETWTLPDGRTGSEIAVELEKAELEQKDYMELADMISRGLLKEPEVFEEGGIG